MTTLRQAAQQALDALAGYRREIGLLTGVPDEQPCDAEVALRAALEQQAEPAQEPAGWFEGPFGAFRANPLYKIAWPASTVAWSIPLYAAPPQRKPLTDDRLWELWNIDSDEAHKNCPRYFQEFRYTARLVEWAHGIGEECWPYEARFVRGNPLTDDGDAFRLAVRLRLEPRFIDNSHSNGAEPSRVTLHNVAGIVENIDGDPLAATRRAIVRAAAEIGRAME